MGGEIGLVVYFAVLVIAGIVGVRMTRGAGGRRLAAIAAALEAHGARITQRGEVTGLLGHPECRFELGAHKGRVLLRWWGRSTWRIQLLLDGAPRPGMWIRVPAAFDGPARLLGLRRTVELATRPAVVATRASERAVEALLAPPEVRRRIEEVVATSAIFAWVGAGNEVSIGPEGVGVVTYTGLGWVFPAERTASLLDHLNALDAALPKLDPAETTPLDDSTTIPASLFSGMAIGFGAAAVMATWRHFPERDEHVQALLGVGALALLVVVALVTRALRGRPQALRELFFLSLGLVIAVPFGVAWLLAVANAVLDASPSVAHRVRVLAFFKHNTHTVWVEPWTAGLERQKVIVPASAAPKLSVGDELVVHERRGALGLPWIESVAKE
jgi:hypothetical protein